MPTIQEDVGANKRVQVVMYALFGHLDGLSAALLPGSSPVPEPAVFDPASLYKLLKPVPNGEAPAKVPGLVTTLRDYQQQAVQWMLEREASKGTKNRASEQWWPIPSRGEGGTGVTVLWYNQFTGSVTNNKSLTTFSDVLKGGILAEGTQYAFKTCCTAQRLTLGRDGARKDLGGDGPCSLPQEDQYSQGETPVRNFPGEQWVRLCRCRQCSLLLQRRAVSGTASAGCLHVLSLWESAT